MVKRIIRYCKICKNLIEDKTKCNNKTICDKEECREARGKAYMKSYNQKYRKKHIKEYKDELFKQKLSRKKIPKWHCQNEGCTYNILLDFDPRKWQNTHKIMEMKCPVCEQQKTP